MEANNMKELERLITKAKEHNADVYQNPEDEKNKYELKIVVSDNDRYIFHKVIIPNLPIGYKASAREKIGNSYNQFTITQNETEEQNKKDCFLEHLNGLNWEMERFCETIFRKFPTITKLSDNDYENKKCKIFEKKYNKLSNHLPIDYKSKSEYKYIDVLCEIEAHLNSFLYCSELENFLNNELEDLELKAKNLEDREMELAKRAKALDLLKQHLDTILITKNT